MILQMLLPYTHYGKRHSWRYQGCERTKVSFFYKSYYKDRSIQFILTDYDTLLLKAISS